MWGGRLAVSDAAAALKGSRLRRTPGKVTSLYVFSLCVSLLLFLLQMADMKKNESACLIGLRRLSNVKRLSNGRHVFLKKRKRKKDTGGETA